MNRSVIFRGRRINSNEWVYGDLIHYSETEYKILEQNERCWDILEGGYDVEKDSIGMAMLFLDKNRKVIFEGDIVKVYNPIPIHEFEGVVLKAYDPIREKPLVCTYSTEYDCFCFIDKGDFDTPYFFSKLDCSLCEVIGNIFENK